jgi:hypothetical protein
MAGVPTVRFQNVLPCKRVETDIAGPNGRPGVGRVDDFRRQILDANSLIIGQNLHAIKRILKLADAAGSAVAQHGDDLRCSVLVID